MPRRRSEAMRARTACLPGLLTATSAEWVSLTATSRRPTIQAGASFNSSVGSTSSPAFIQAKQREAWRSPRLTSLCSLAATDSARRLPLLWRRVALALRRQRLNGNADGQDDQSRLLRLSPQREPHPDREGPRTGHQAESEARDSSQSTDFSRQGLVP